MAEFTGDKLKIEISGQSHSEYICGKGSGFPETKIDFDALESFMQRRKAGNFPWSTKRVEDDIPEFEGLDGDKISGDFSFSIKNGNAKSKDYDSLYGKPRPSHADYVRYLRDGTLDFSGGGEFSGRMTAPFCVFGGIAKQILFEKYGTEIFAYLSKVGKIKGKSYKTDKIEPSGFENIGKFPSLSNSDEMIEEITRASSEGDSLGATVECIVFNPKKAIGGSLFQGVEGKISSLVFAIPGVKGVEFGAGFGLSEMKGSEANDELFFDGNGEIALKSNNAGGLNGGMTNGFPVTLSVVFRPTPSVYREQSTVDLVNKSNVSIKIEGRHDSCIAVRGVPVVESAVALALLDFIGE